MYNIEYTALKYYNSPISEECLYVGMLFHNLDTDRRDFKCISNFNRFQSFDDEADVGFVKYYLQGIKNDVEATVTNFSRFNLNEYIKIFINEFKFSKVSCIQVEDDENYVDNLSKLYLKYDYSKKLRLSDNEEKKYIKKILLSNNVDFDSPDVCGLYNEEIKFDYVLKDIGVKIFSFKDKQLKKQIPTAKNWSFSAYELKPNMNVVFLYDDVPNLSDKSELNTVLDILKTNAEVYTIQEGLDYLLQKVSQ